MLVVQEEVEGILADREMLGPHLQPAIEIGVEGAQCLARLIRSHSEPGGMHRRLRTERRRQLFDEQPAPVGHARGSLDEHPHRFLERGTEIVEKGGASGIFHAISEPDVERILKHPATMIASDGEIPVFGQAAPHPRSYGTWARVLGVYVRERRIITLEDAVRKMTSLPAQVMRLGDRGFLREGYWADVVVFDPRTVRDTATFEKPEQYPVGIEHVLVNGVPVIRGGEHTGARPGKAVRGAAYAAR